MVDTRKSAFNQAPAFGAFSIHLAGTLTERPNPVIFWGWGGGGPKVGSQHCDPYHAIGSCYTLLPYNLQVQHCECTIGAAMISQLIPTTFFMSNFCMQFLTICFV